MQTDGTIKITNAFSETTDTTPYSLATFYVYLTNVTSPRSTAPTSSFHAQIYDSSNYLNYEVTTGVTAAVD
jgi:hypothetical protein